MNRRRISIASVCIYLFLALFSLFCLFPMVLTIVVSFSDENSITKNGYSLFPDRLTLDAYRLVFSQGGTIFHAYFISAVVTIGGTFLALLVTSMAAYTLSNKTVKYRNVLALYFFITTLFSAGLVPWYLMCQKLGLLENIWSLIVPNLLFSAFNMFLVRNFMDSLPGELRESAYVDGANDLRIAFQIYLPLCLPVLATICLFYALGYWNDWFNAIMLVSNKELYPIQYLLLQIKSNIDALSMIPTGTQMVAIPSESTKMATVALTVGPIVLLYPFLQRYFVKGLIVGSVKG
ncbi:carbohydrate ABC transporter permease [Paenibacillus lycopersici]|uniref:Carbohydrate ABC transporter permease n=1 Tax=Paenibacillus lycopersici TaxID=2704462 RepID=A0A6C0G3M2_9BACL|nr:carbohydrate ABC transporter permease [Paenibacillus lycopersici]QHT62371.1 carbohydrate ABC transporter permease [Paenibacillus lycopersici]